MPTEYDARKRCCKESLIAIAARLVMDGWLGVRFPLPTRLAERIVNADVNAALATPIALPREIATDTLAGEATLTALAKLLLTIEAAGDDAPYELVDHAAGVRAICEEWGLDLPRLEPSC